jgi:hypothetical protein
VSIRGNPSESLRCDHVILPDYVTPPHEEIVNSSAKDGGIIAYTFRPSVADIQGASNTINAAPSPFFFLNKHKVGFLT